LSRQIETAYLELKSTILGGRVLRARTPTGLNQEIHAPLITYQAPRIAISDATLNRPDPDPDRASFTVALAAARDQLVQTAGVITDTTVDLVGGSRTTSPRPPPVESADPAAKPPSTSASCVSVLDTQLTPLTAWLCA
jgi:hypothetical protein